MRFAFFILVLCFIALPATAETIVGYQNKGSFVPLVSVDRQAKSLVKSNQHDVAADRLTPAFAPELSLPFYMVCDGDCMPLTAQATADDFILDFYRFMARDSWGQHFVKKEWLAGPTASRMPLAEITRKSSVTPLAQTDLNANDLPEFWISYRLMHGETGFAVYEQDRHGAGWLKIADRCPGCD